MLAQPEVAAMPVPSMLSSHSLYALNDVASMVCRAGFSPTSRTRSVPTSCCGPLYDQSARLLFAYGCRPQPRACSSDANTRGVSEPTRLCALPSGRNASATPQLAFSVTSGSVFQEAGRDISTRGLKLMSMF